MICDTVKEPKHNTLAAPCCTPSRPTLPRAKHVDAWLATPSCDCALASALAAACDLASALAAACDLASAVATACDLASAVPTDRLRLGLGLGRRRRRLQHRAAAANR